MCGKKMDPEEFVRAGEAIYKRIKDELEKEHMGEVVLIEVESGDYFVAPTLAEAYEKASRKYPGRLFYVRHVGRRLFMRLLS